MKTMNSKFPGKCNCGCGARFNTGTQILWSKATGAMLPGHGVDASSPKVTRRDAAPKMPRWNSAARRNFDDYADHCAMLELEAANMPPAMGDAEFASLAAAGGPIECDGTLDYNEGC